MTPHAPHPGVFRSRQRHRSIGFGNIAIDAGSQIDKFNASLDVRYRQLFEEQIELPEDSYPGQDIIDVSKEIRDAYGDKFLKLKGEQSQKELAVLGNELMINGMIMIIMLIYDIFLKLKI